MSRKKITYFSAVEIFYFTPHPLKNTIYDFVVHFNSTSYIYLFLFWNQKMGVLLKIKFGLSNLKQNVDFLFG